MELMHKHGKQFCSWNRLEMLSTAFFLYIKQTYIETAEISIYISMQSSKSRGKRNYIYYQQSDAMSYEKHTQVLFLWNFYIDLYRWIIYKFLQIFCDIKKKECKQSLVCDGVHIRFLDEYFANAARNLNPKININLNVSKTH